MHFAAQNFFQLLRNHFTAKKYCKPLFYRHRRRADKSYISLLLFTHLSTALRSYFLYSFLPTACTVCPLLYFTFLLLVYHTLLPCQLLSLSFPHLMRSKVRKQNPNVLQHLITKYSDFVKPFYFLIHRPPAKVLVCFFVSFIANVENRCFHQWSRCL